MEIDKERGRIGLSRKELLDKPKDYIDNRNRDFRDGNRNSHGHTNHNDPHRQGGFRKKF